MHVTWTNGDVWTTHLCLVLVGRLYAEVLVLSIELVASCVRRRALLSPPLMGLQFIVSDNLYS